MRKLIGILCLQLILGNGWIYAASAEADSLLRLLPQKTGKEKIEVLLRVSNLLKYDLPDSARRFAQSAVELSTSQNYSQGEADGKSILGTIAYLRGNTDSALKCHYQALAIRLVTGDEQKIANSYNDLGAIHDRAGQPDSALSYYHKAQKIYEQLKDDQGLAETYNNIGVFYYREGELPKAIEYLEKCLAIDRHSGDQTGIATTLSNLGAFAFQLGDFRKSLDYHREALSIRRALDSPLQISRSLNNIAMVYDEMGDFEKAITHYQEALHLKREINHPFETVETTLNLARSYRDVSDVSSALKYASEALQIADSSQFESQKELALGLLADIYALKKDYRKAFEYLKSQYDLQHKLLTKDKNQKVAEMMAKYEAEKNRLEIEQLNLEKEKATLKLSKVNQRNTVLIVTILLVLVLATFFLVLAIYRTRTNRELSRLNEELEERNGEVRKQNEEIERQKELLEEQNHQILHINSRLEKLVEERTEDLLRANEELDIFFYQSSHALRSPLVRLSGLLELAASESDPNTKGQLEANISLTLRRMDNMLRKLNQVSGLSHREIKPVPIDLEQTVRDTLDGSQLELPAFSKWRNLQISQEGPTFGDPHFYQVILSNLLENAWQFADQGNTGGPKVKISLVHDQEKDVLVIEDEGVGISDKVQSHIFDMFYRGSELSKGDGLGLFVVRKAVERLGGSVQVQSSPGEFTRFVITLPTGKKNTPANRAGVTDNS